MQAGGRRLRRQAAHREIDGEVARRFGHEGDDVESDGEHRRVERRRDRHDRHVVGDAQSAVGQFGEHRRVHVVGRVDRKGGRSGVEQLADGTAGRRDAGALVARRVKRRADAELRGAPLERPLQPGREVGGAVGDLRLPDQPDRGVTGVVEAIDGELGGSLEVEVDADQALGVIGDADEHRRRLDPAGDRDARVGGRDVEHEDRVDEAARGDPAHHGGRLLVGEEQDVVVVAPRRDGCRENERHVRRRVGVFAQGLGEREDLGAAARQHPCTGIGAVPEFAHRLLDALARARRDGALAAQRVRDGADRDTGGLGHFVDLRHRDSVVVSPAARPRCRSGIRRSA